MGPGWCNHWFPLIEPFRETEQCKIHTERVKERRERERRGEGTTQLLSSALFLTTSSALGGVVRTDPTYEHTDTLTHIHTEQKQSELISLVT